jgi:addiction module HigA family antidote
MSKSKKLNEGGIQGTGEGLVNQNSESFKKLQELIESHSKEQSASEQLWNRLISLRFQMEFYLKEEMPEELKPAGYYLERYIEALEIKKKDFASYIGYQESNLSAILKGRRSISTDLAIKLGEIFQIDPALWLNIQSKNDLLKIIQRDKKKYNKYSLEDLLDEVK